MFENLDKPKSGSIEDIFADAEIPISAIPPASKVMPSPTSSSSPIPSPMATPRMNELTFGNQSKSRWPLVAAAAIIVVGVIAGGYWWWTNQQKETGQESVIVNNSLPTENQPSTTNSNIVIEQPAQATDTDGDGLTDAEERQLGADPLKSDTDTDGLMDGEEVKVYHTNPLVVDSDGDGYIDSVEIKNGFNPNGSGLLPDYNIPTKP